MTAITKQSPGFNDVKLVKLAREIAMDISPVHEILHRHEIGEAEWDELQANTAFKSYLSGAIQEWHSATNTAERVRLKSLAFVEEALPEFFARAHAADENLQHKVRTLEVVAKFAGLGANVEGAVVGERMTVTINLGADNQLRIEKDVTPVGNQIEGEAL